VVVVVRGLVVVVVVAGGPDPPRWKPCWFPLFPADAGVPMPTATIEMVNASPMDMASNARRCRIANICTPLGP
jgi:hypothetical protein